MRNLFRLMLLFAAAICTLTFASCGSDDDEIKEENVSFYFQMCVTDELYQIADITITGTSPISLDQSIKVDGVEGLGNQLLVVSGQKAKEAKIDVTFKLKSNWREIIGDKTSIELYTSIVAEVHRGQSILHDSDTGLGNKLNLTKIKDSDLEKVLTDYLKDFSCSKSYVGILAKYQLKP